MNYETRPWLDGVEGEEAVELIESNAKVIRVIAGPGSGKTFCLGRRTWRLIVGDRIKQRKIFVGTFTRAMAKELQNELAAYQNVKVSTLHSFAYELLRGLLQEDPEALHGMKLRFLLDFERDALLYDLKDEFCYDYYKCRDELLEMEASLAKLDDSYENTLFRGAVERWLRRHQAMLVGYVVYLCVNHLQFEDIQPGMFDHVVIDEFQDLTAAEQELIGLLWSCNGSLTVMGDDFQSIYGFRFNQMKGITDFHEEWKNRGYECVDISFSKNRRCGRQILKAANRMLASAGSPTPMLWGNERIGRLDLVHWDTLEEETKGLATYIKYRSEEQFLVLVPRRFLGYRLKEEIGKDARTMFTQEVLDHKIAQEIFTEFALLADPNDRVAVRVWLGFKHGESDYAASRNSVAYAKSLSDVSPAVGGHELLRKIVDEEIEVTGRGQKNIKERAKKAIELIDRNLEPREIVDYLFNPARAKCETNDDKRLQLRDSLEKLRAAAHKLLEEQDNPDLGKILNVLRYRIATRAPLVPDDEEPRVKIMTIHSAKGLEEDNIVIAGAVDQLIPGRAGENEEIEEQTRLLYVALTRAKDLLIVSWPKHISPPQLMKENNGRDRPISHHNGIVGVRTKCSRFIPVGITQPNPGVDWLLENAASDVNDGI